MEIDRPLSRSAFTFPYDSTTGLSLKTCLIIIIPFVLFVLYVAIKVYISLKNDRYFDRIKANQEADNEL